jgi:5-methylcytosine-specific restriction endonuclease McrA
LKVCSIDACESTHYGRGFCKSHYMKWYKHGDPLWRRADRTPRHGTASEYDNFGCRCEPCKSAKRSVMTEYYWRDPESQRARNRAKADIGWQRQYRHANRDRINEQRRTRVATDPEYRARRVAQTLDWARRNPELESQRSARRRARKASAETLTVTPRDWRRVLHRHRHSCAYCGCQRPLTQEHIVPLARGGRHAIGNLIPVCRSCNSSKGSKLLIEWRSLRLLAAA